MKFIKDIMEQWRLSKQSMENRAAEAAKRHRWLDSCVSRDKLRRETEMSAAAVNTLFSVMVEPAAAEARVHKAQDRAPLAPVIKVRHTDGTVEVRPVTFRPTQSTLDLCTSRVERNTNRLHRAVQLSARTDKEFQLDYWYDVLSHVKQVQA